MDNRPSAGNGLLIPILIGILSLAGIGLILFIVYLDTQKADAPVNPTTTPFRYLLLATETDVVNPDANTANSTVAPTEIEDAQSATQTSIIENPTGTTTTPQAALTPATILDEASILSIGKYDEMDERIIYSGDWTGELLIPGAYEETISYSTTIGSSASFTFTGQQLQIGYLGETDLGALLISINGNEYLLDQSNGNEWSSPVLPDSTYSVILTHEDGEQVFLDYINIIRSP